MIKFKNRINIFLILFVLLIPFFSANASTRIDPFTGLEKPLTTKVDGITMTVKDNAKQLFKGSSSFNCETGEIGLDLSVAEDIEGFFKSYGESVTDSMKGMIKEMAMQTGVELMLDLAALIHYKVTQENADGSSIFQGLAIAEAAKCMTSTFFNALEIDFEAGIGTGLFDLFSGKAGINFVSILGVFGCIKDAFGFPKDADAKKRFEKSRRWVRHLLYKILNESFDMLFNIQASAGKLDPKCKELETRIKKNNLEVSLAQLGSTRTPMGTDIMSYVEVGEPTAVAYKKALVDDPNTKNNPKKMDDEQKKSEVNLNNLKAEEEALEKTSANTQADRDKKEQDLKNVTMKKAVEQKYIFEVPLSTTSVQTVDYDIIDVSDMTSDEVRIFNKNVYDTVYESIMKTNTSDSKRKKEAFMAVLEKIFNITTTSSKMLDAKHEILNRKDKDGDYVYQKNTSKSTILQTDYYGGLLSKADYFNSMKTNYLSTYEQLRTNTNMSHRMPSRESNIPVEELVNIEYSKKKIEKLKRWDIYKNSIAGGYPIFFDLSKPVSNNYNSDLERHQGANALENQLHTDEGFRQNPYNDSLGYCTIGYGHLIAKMSCENLETSNPTTWNQYKDGWTKEKADQIFSNDLNTVKSQVYSSLPWLKDKPVSIQNNLINMAYNMGIGNASAGSGLLGFKNTLKYIENDEFEKASEGLTNSKWYGQVGDRSKRIVSDFEQLAKMQNSGELYQNTMQDVIHPINGGEVKITSITTIEDIVYNQFQKDLVKYRGAGLGTPNPNITYDINELVLLRKPLHELEFLKVLYQLESAEQILHFISTRGGEEVYKAPIDTNNFTQIDVDFKRNSYFVSAKTGDIYQYPVETVNYILKRIKFIKQMYAVEILDLYAKRIKAINHWMTKSLQKKGISNNNALKEFKLTELEKVKLKMLQKRLLVKLLLEKEVK